MLTLLSCFLFQKAENEARRAKKEAPLPEEDLNKLFKPLQPPSRLERLVLAGQIASYADHVSEFAGQSFGKLFMAEALNSDKPQAAMLWRHRCESKTS